MIRPYPINVHTEFYNRATQLISGCERSGLYQRRRSSLHQRRWRFLCGAVYTRGEGGACAGGLPNMKSVRSFPQKKVLLWRNSFILCPRRGHTPTLHWPTHIVLLWKWFCQVTQLMKLAPCTYVYWLFLRYMNASVRWVNAHMIVNL